MTMTMTMTSVGYHLMTGWNEGWSHPMNRGAMTMTMTMTSDSYHLMSG